MLMLLRAVYDRWWRWEISSWTRRCLWRSVQRSILPNSWLSVTMVRSFSQSQSVCLFICPSVCLSQCVWLSVSVIVKISAYKLETWCVGLLRCIYIHFYRAVLCIARTMPSQEVYPSFRPSHTSIVSKRLNLSSNFFHQRVATLRDLHMPYSRVPFRMTLSDLWVTYRNI